MKLKLMFLIVMLIYSASVLPANIHDIPVTSSNKIAVELFRQGQRLIDIGRPMEARSLLNQAIKLDPGFSYAYLLLANSNFSAFSAGYNLLANTGISPKEFKNNLDEAMKHIEGKSSGEKMLIEIHKTFIDNDTTKRVELANAIVREYPRSPRAWLTNGFVLGTINQNRESRESMLKAIELDPRFLAAHYEIAFSYLFSEPRNFDEAAKHFRKCVELEPSEGKGYEGLGDAYRAMNQLEQAADAYNRAANADRKMTTAIVKKGHVNSFLGKYDEARADYDRAIDQEPDPVNQVFYTHSRAFVHLHGNDPDAALKELERIASSLEKQNLNTEERESLMQATLTNSLTIALHSNNLSAAQTILTELKRANLKIHERLKDANLKRQSDAACILWEGQLAARQMKIDAARSKADEYRKLMESDRSPRKLEGYYELFGLIAFQQDNFADAIASYKKADRSSIYVKYYLGKAYAKNGQTENAIKELQDAAHYNFNTVEFALLRKEALRLLQELSRT